MHHQPFVLGARPAAARAASEQLVAIGRGEDVVERVAAMRPAVTGGDRQQVEVVVAEHRDGARRRARARRAAPRAIPGRG